MKALSVIIALVFLHQIFAEPAQCPGSPDGVMCDGCQCCPNLKMCPNAESCTFKCPKDGELDPTQDPKKPTTTRRPITTPAMPDPDPDSGSGVHRIKFDNKCTQDIWIGTLNNPGRLLPHRGGFYLKKKTAYTMTLPREWAGRFWGRTHCAYTSNGQFKCETGDCGRRFECKGNGGEPPVTLAEFTFDANGMDYFDVSLVDGYNLPMKITPIKGSYVPDAPGSICEECGCDSDLNTICPKELWQLYNKTTVACKSACAGFNTDQYCCRGEYNCSPHNPVCGPGGSKICDPATWPVNYASIFKRACPTAYSYAYDDPSSTFMCAGATYAHYDITFCP